MNRALKSLEQAKVERTASFSNCVRTAYEAEGVQTDDQIAKRLGITPSALCQLLTKPPDKLQPKTVKMLARGLGARAHREEVFAAWHQATFEDDGGYSVVSLPEGLRQVRYLSRNRQPRLALGLVHALLEAQHGDPIATRQLLEAMCGLSYDLDELPEALEAANTLISLGRSEQDNDTLAAGLVLRARLLRDVAGASTRTILNELHLIAPLLGKSDERARPHWHVSADTVRRDQELVLLHYYEQKGNAAQELRGLLKSVQLRVRASDSTAKISSSLRTESRIWLALDNPFKAEELLDASDQIGSRAGGTEVKTALLAARISVKRRAIEEAENSLVTLRARCLKEHRMRLYRIASRDLGMLRAQMYPPSHPV